MTSCNILQINEYKCQKCHRLLQKPIQAECGHRFCTKCFQPVECVACAKENIYLVLDKNKAFFDAAVNRKILSSVIKCLTCDWTGLADLYLSQHEGFCKFELIQCTNCTNFVLRGNIENHQIRECEFRILACKYCKITFCYKDIKTHDESCLKFPIQCSICGKKKIPREKFIDHSKNCVKPCLFKEAGCQYTGNDQKLDEHEKTNFLNHLQIAFNFLKEPDLYQSSEVKTLENIVCVLNREVERYSIQSKQDRDTINKLSLEIESLKYCTYDGIFLWKIANYSKQKPILTSPAFFSHKYGYKMCLCLYLNGNGLGNNTHLSLFIHILKGDYDELLQWPFNGKITFILLNQHNKEHVIDMFRTDLTSDSFKQPTCDINIASGCPQFCSLKKVSNYIKNDVIFIKVIVELN